MDDLHVNGKLTLGENTADNGGLRLAWMALLADAASNHTSLDQKTATGYTPKQELFLGWGQNWCASERPEFLRLAVQVDVHSPDRIRANGVIVNMPEFGAGLRLQDRASRCRRRRRRCAASGETAVIEAALRVGSARAMGRYA